MQIFDGLFGLTPQGKVVPQLVERWETQDNKMWTFHLRKGVHFHQSPIFKNGTREVTAEDLKYSLSEYCRPTSYNAFLLLDSLKGAAAFNKGEAKAISGLQVVDTHTLQVELNKADPSFINRMSTPLLTIFPREAATETWAKEHGFSVVVGTGPYRLVSRSESEIVIERNPDYWNKEQEIQVDKWTFRVIKNDQTRLANIMKGQIDIMKLPTSQFPAVFAKGNKELRGNLQSKFAITRVSTFNTNLIGINLNRVPDVNLRKAMFWGTNRKQMVDSVLYGSATPTSGPIPHGLDGYDSPFGQDFHSLNKARKFLAQSDYKGEPLELIVHNLANSTLIGQLFKAQMAQVGINIQLKEEDFGAAVNRIVTGNTQLFSMFFEYAFSSPEPIVQNLFASAKIPVPNFFHYSNAAVDTKLGKLNELLSRDERYALTSQIEKQVMEDAPSLFLYQQGAVLLHSKKLQGIEANGNDHYFLEKVRIQP